MKHESDELPGWTDDCSVTVAPEHTLDELVTFVLECDERRTPHRQMMHALTVEFALSFEDARLAVDRVRGGRFRAKTARTVNRPDAVKDPVAHIAYQRARGEPARTTLPRVTPVWRSLIRLVEAADLRQAMDYAKSPELAKHAHPHEVEAASLWCEAVTAQEETRAATSATAAVRLFELAEALVRAGGENTILTNVLLQVGTAISSVGESRIDELPEHSGAAAGTPAWFDAIRLSETAARLAALFRQIDDENNEEAALNLRGRITTRLLGHRPHRVGAVMLDSATCAIRHRKPDRAASLCDAVIREFAKVVDECEDEGPVCDEDELALQQLLEAIDFHREIRGFAAEDTERLRARCLALLSETDQGDEAEP